MIIFLEVAMGMLLPALIIAGSDIADYVEDRKAAKEKAKKEDLLFRIYNEL